MVQVEEETGAEWNELEARGMGHSPKAIAKLRRMWKSAEARRRKGVADPIEQYDALARDWLKGQSPRLVEALDVGHEVTNSMRTQLKRKGALSVKQVRYALSFIKASDDASDEKYDKLPEDLGPQLVQGKVLSVKYKEDQRRKDGGSWKLLIEFEHEDGTSKLYGDVPPDFIAQSEASNNNLDSWLCGSVICFEVKKITRSLAAMKGSDSFGFFQGPSEGEVL